MSFRALRVCFVLAVVVAIIPRDARGQAVESGPGSSTVNYASPCNGDIDIRESPFATTNGQFVGDGVGTSANAGFDLIESPTNSGYEVLLDLNRVGATGTFSKAFGTQDITALSATATVMYTFNGNINFTSPGVNFSTDLFQIGQSTPLLSEQYDMSNLSGGLAGSLAFGPVSGELLPGQAIEWDWSAEISPDAVADTGASLRANLDLTFISLPEPTITCGLLFGLLLMTRRRWVTRP